LTARGEINAGFEGRQLRRMQRWRGRERGAPLRPILYRDEMRGEASVDRHGAPRPRRALAHNTEARWSLKPTGGFTLVEVLVALVVVALGLAALMVSVSGAARTSGYLRDKTLAQWIALNRLTEVREHLTDPAPNTDTVELKFAGRTWHYDTRYFDTSVVTMKRVVVRVFAGDAKTKGNPLMESSSFLSTAIAAPGSANSEDWSLGTGGPTEGTTNKDTVSGSGASP
jgi:general secretion pathway protein I